ncbi:MAG: nuclear transport factor 2 family protein [Maribacter dokdonensis]|uniref:nuclear transport factor 2 family protein n=1 Tax=Maribacter dokdonensis TaxID=320912 RepID=UPI003296E803
MSLKLKCFILLLSAISCIQLYAQQSTEVYLTNLGLEKDSISINGAINISENEGYDNQPSFLDNDRVLYAATRNGQTDIVLFHIKDKTLSWITDTPNGSEYSPLKIPGKNAVSAIRLDEDGLQRLYEYNLDTNEQNLLLEDLKVGYHVWYTEDIIICTVLRENKMDLVITNLKDHTNITVQQNVGRSLHNIPNSDLVSYISKSDNGNMVKSLHPISLKTKDIISLPKITDDIFWMSSNQLITAIESTILSFDPKVDTEWKIAHEINNPDINGISRLAISPDGNYLSFVSKDSQKNIVDKQVETFNARELQAFANCFSKNVVVKNYPKDTLYIGREILKEKYLSFYDRTPNIDVKVSSRIHLGKTVIDQEQITIGDKQFQQVAIYEVDGLINSMTFIKDKSINEDPEIPVQQQLEGYNAKDINAFLGPYAKNVKVYGANGELRTEGIENMRNGYDRFFSTTPNLHCEIKNRIVIGNIVIDEEFITVNGDSYTAIGIYEIENNKIAKVTFLH